MPWNMGFLETVIAVARHGAWLSGASHRDLVCLVAGTRRTVGATSTARLEEDDDRRRQFRS